MPKKGKLFSVDTRPSKDVVVDSLTRDISVEACIFDLIDNSIDAARETVIASTGEERTEELPEFYDNFKIALSFSGDGCSIDDNCGGITVDRLKKMVLRFGQRSSHSMGIGIFGLGLNRALFKLGKVSHLKTDTGFQRAELVLNTDEYIKSDDWDLPAEEFKSSGKIGTAIEITRLPEDIAHIFSDNEWIEEHRSRISRRYGRFIRKGLNIEVNGENVLDGEVAIREKSPFTEEYKFYRKDGVTIHIRAGQHIDHRFSAEPDYEKARNAPLTEQFGWTILCNDRAIVISDQTWRTGWDTKFHTEFYGFVGIVSFDAEDPSKLPWDTTKSNVDMNNKVYQTALIDMRKFAEKWRSFANRAKDLKRKNEPLLSPPATGKPISNPQQPPTQKPTPSNTKPVTKPSATKADKPKIKKDHNEFATILPEDVDEQHCFDKHLAIVHEAKQLDLNVLTYSGMALLRALFETTVMTYFDRHGKLSEIKQFAINRRKDAGANVNEVQAVPSLDEMIAFLEKNPDAWGTLKQNHLKHSLTRMTAHKKLLNGAVHNPYQPINRTTAFIIRDEILPILRYLIET